MSNEDETEESTRTINACMQYRKETKNIPRNRRQTPTPINKIFTRSAYCSVCGEKTINENGLCSEH